MGGVGGGRLFEGGRLLTFSAFGMGASSRWALIRGWALIRINTVIPALVICVVSGLEAWRNVQKVNESQKKGKLKMSDP